MLAILENAFQVFSVLAAIILGIGVSFVYVAWLGKRLGLW